MLVVGIAGAGKSALMAKSAYRATELAEDGMIKNMPGWDDFLIEMVL